MGTIYTSRIVRLPIRSLLKQFSQSSDRAYAPHPCTATWHPPDSFGQGGKPGGWSLVLQVESCNDPTIQNLLQIDCATNSTTHLHMYKHPPSTCANTLPFHQHPRYPTARNIYHLEMSALYPLKFISPANIPSFSSHDREQRPHGLSQDQDWVPPLLFPPPLPLPRPRGRLQMV
jgi:hypothetical protein